MAITYQKYTGNGSLTTFPISFDWIYASDVIVSVDGYLKSNGTDYNIVNKNVVFTAAPSNGTLVKISRSSNLTSRNVDFVNGSRLDETDLDNSAKQLFYLIQEIKDQTDDLTTQLVNAASALIVDGSVTNAKLAADAVTTSKLADASVTSSKVAALAITPSKLSTGGPSWDTSGNLSINAYFTSFARDAANAVLGMLQMYTTASGAVLNQVMNLPMYFLTNNITRLTIAADGTINANNNPITNSPTTAKAHAIVNTLNNTSGASQAFTGYNVASIVRGATAGLYTITLSSGTFTGPAMFVPLSAVNNSGIRVAAYSANTCQIQAYVGATATDMAFNFVYFA